MTSLLLCEKLRSLGTLSLDFPKDKYLSNFTMGKLGESVSKSLENLKRFSLSQTRAKPSSSLVTKARRTIFGGNDLSDQDLVSSGKALTQKTTYLEYLRLQIQQCPGISDEGVKEFCRKLGLAKNLKRGGLSFEGCEKVTVEPRNYSYYYDFY